MHTTIRDLKAYHKSIGLHIDMYHLDSGFWHSAHADGHCDGVCSVQPKLQLLHLLLDLGMAAALKRWLLRYGSK
eukprot:COSAG02_NODE_380_length_23483_cov_8.034382_8_plen_74_part_00